MDEKKSEQISPRVFEINNLPRLAIVLLFILTWLLGAYPSFRYFIVHEAFGVDYRQTSFSIVLFLLMAMFCEGIVRYNKKNKK